MAGEGSKPLDFGLSQGLTDQFLAEITSLMSSSSQLAEILQDSKPGSKQSVPSAALVRLAEMALHDAIRLDMQFRNLKGKLTSK